MRHPSVTLSLHNEAVTARRSALRREEPVGSNEAILPTETRQVDKAHKALVFKKTKNNIPFINWDNLKKILKGIVTLLSSVRSLNAVCLSDRDSMKGKKAALSHVGFIYRLYELDARPGLRLLHVFLG